MDFIENISIMLGGIHFKEQDIMIVVRSFYIGSKEDMENKQEIVIHDATKLHPRDQQRISIVDKYNQGRQVILKMRKLKLTLKNMLPLLKMTLELMLERRRPIKDQK